jgi:hypothetical protein
LNRLFLVYGMPGAGKTYMVKTLEEHHAFRRLSVDEAYVEHVRSDWPNLYFPALDDFIQPHYHLMLRCRPYCESRFGRDFVDVWHSYLLSAIRSLLDADAVNLVVEGYLLYDCREDIEAALRDRAQVFQILADDKSYFWHKSRWRRNRLSIEDIAALGA